MIFEVWIVYTLFLFFSFELYSYIWKYLWSSSYFFIILNVESRAQKVSAWRVFHICYEIGFFSFLVMDKMVGIVTFNKVLKCCVYIVVEQCLFSMNVKFNLSFSIEISYKSFSFYIIFLLKSSFFFNFKLVKGKSSRQKL